jgi:N-formylglutamate amidohydrolase
VKLPLIISVPHAGLRVPPEVADICFLAPQDIMADSDEGAAEIYAIDESVAAFVSTDIARAIVDMNRPPDDFTADGVIKSHTCWDVPVYRTSPSPAFCGELLSKYYHPYHNRLTEAALSGVVLGLDCHTMAEFGPPHGPDQGCKRPRLCLSNAEITCSETWLHGMAACLEECFDSPVSLNHPFRGGHICRSHAQEIPWLQIEFSREDFLPLSDKRRRLLAALALWCGRFA